jgi:cathepsin B
MVSCDKANMACNGGYLNKAFNYLKKSGVVEEDCLPYVSGDGSVPACPNTCVDGFTKKTWTEDKHFCKKTNSFWMNKNIKKEIFENGPVETGFKVYQDFIQYKSGVYRHTSGGMLGGHAVEIVGWSFDQDGEYWICKNSWGTAWGEEGYFRIAFGQCGIDSTVYSCEV